MFALVKCVFVLCAAVAASGFGLGPLDVVFHLYRRQNPNLSEVLLPTINSIAASNYDPDIPTVLTIHNYGEGVGGNFNAFLVPAHLGAAAVNLVAVDWSAGSGMYTQGLANAVECGARIASFINILSSEFGYSPSNFRIVGVGLGAHVAGIAADRVNGDIPHVVAIDPSLTGWTHHSGKLKPEQAQVVEVIHCTAGSLGYDYPLGDLDFYPNGGSYQSSCGANPDCSHTLCYAFYAESVSEANGSRFVGTACDSYDEAISNTCEGEKDAVFGGLEDKSGQSGVYYFETNWSPPFAQG